MSAKKPEDVAPIGGTGVLTCQVCGDPLRDHRVGARCPKWDGILRARVTSEPLNPSPETVKRRRYPG